ncbi:lysophospholipid acyltransferase family protein [Nocardioides sp. SYSU DS0663]|uniref:lysophospholipid acyltransferase family protein n=1 Tax=Nocardioides sp. SYSU DS0663 TaxID=3416445 RepID=UPI003F4B311D
MTVRRLQQGRGWAWSLAVAIVKPSLLATTRRNWIDGERIPVTGGCLIVLNHLSHVDPLTAAHLVYDHGRIPRYLAKSGLFRNPVLGFFMRAAGQIPVERLSAGAAGAYDAAVAAVRAGECVVVYPEGTLTRDPDLWPMTGKSGAARIALETGCPVIPVGQWGAQHLLPPYAKKPDLRPRKTITMKVGEPVDLADLLTRPRSPEVVQEATDRIMASITALVAEVRGEEPPVERFDPRRAGIKQTGNPNARRVARERRERRRRLGKDSA